MFYGNDRRNGIKICGNNCWWNVIRIVGQLNQNLGVVVSLYMVEWTQIVGGMESKSG